MGGEIGRELVEVDRPPGEREVVHRPVGRESHGQSDVAELEVEVDDRGAHSGLSEGDREVGARERLPGSALRPEDGDDPTLVRALGAGAAQPACDRLLDGELELLRRLRHHEDVLAPCLEHASDEAVRGVLAENEHRTSGVGLDGAVEQRQRSLGIARGPRSRARRPGSRRGRVRRPRIASRPGRDGASRRPRRGRRDCPGRSRRRRRGLRGLVGSRLPIYRLDSDWRLPVFRLVGFAPACGRIAAHSVPASAATIMSGTSRVFI